MDADFAGNEDIGNGGDGLHIDLSSDVETQLFGEGNTVRDNGGDGMDVSVAAPVGHRYYDVGGWLAVIPIRKCLLG